MYRALIGTLILAAASAAPGFAQTPIQPVATARGLGHECSLDPQGQARCSGDNRYGQLGSLNRISGPARPVVVGARFVQITAGDRHSCALTADGRVFCWGANDAGQLGGRPRVAGDCDGLACALAPLHVRGLGSIVRLSAGAAHTCAAAADGAVWCWGANDQQQLGREPEGSCRGMPCAITARRVPMVLAVNRLEAERDRTCGTTGVRTYCWGENAPVRELAGSGSGGPLQ